MGIFSFSLPPDIAFLAILAALAIIFYNGKSAPWKALTAPGTFSAWCFSIIMLPMLWSFEIPVVRGLTLHMLGMPLFVLMFGRQLSIIGISLSVIAYSVMNHSLLSNIGMNLMLLAVLPAYCGDMVMRATKRFFPHHMFIYLLGNGFFGALLMLAVIGLISLAAHWLWIVSAPIRGDTVAYMLLLAWGESFLTGFLLTIFTVYRPNWVLTFDDDVYLQGK